MHGLAGHKGNYETHAALKSFLEPQNNQRCFNPPSSFHLSFYSFLFGRKPHRQLWTSSNRQQAIPRAMKETLHNASWGGSRTGCCDIFLCVPSRQYGILGFRFSRGRWARQHCYFLPVITKSSAYRHIHHMGLNAGVFCVWSVHNPSQQAGKVIAQEAYALFMTLPLKQRKWM